MTLCWSRAGALSVDGLKLISIPTNGKDFLKVRGQYGVKGAEERPGSGVVAVQSYFLWLGADRLSP